MVSSLDFTDVMVFKIALMPYIHSLIVQACRTCSLVKSTFPILFGKGLGYKLRKSNDLLNRALTDESKTCVWGFWISENRKLT